MAIITLTTDFGTADHYVAAVKGAILSAEPRTTLVDVTHHIPPGGIAPAAFVLGELPRTFPPGTVHLAVIDPTVGTRRVLLAARSAGQFFIAPDNGLLTYVQRRWGLEALRVVSEPAGPGVSRTFHGRDVMAPAAALLARRGRIEELGPATDRLELLNLADPVHQPDGSIVGEVLYVDRFGNCVTNVSESLLRRAVAAGPGLTVHAGSHRIGPPAATYADVPPMAPVALIGSAELLEIAVNLGSAAERLGLAVGSPVVLRHE